MNIYIYTFIHLTQSVDGERREREREKNKQEKRYGEVGKPTAILQLLRCDALVFAFFFFFFFFQDFLFSLFQIDFQEVEGEYLIFVRSFVRSVFFFFPLNYDKRRGKS